MSTAIAPLEPADAAQPGPEPEPRRPLVQRLPAPVFVVGYGALVLACVVGIAMAASASGSGGSPAPLSTTVAQPEPIQPYNPPPADEANVRASVRPYLITDLHTATTDNGVIMRGTLTDSAESQLPELSGHLSRLLAQNCLAAVTLKTPDNARVNFYGFCLSTVSEDTILNLVTLALEHDADEVTFTDNRVPDGLEASVAWYNAGSDAQLSKLETLWADQTRPAGLGKLRFAAYGTDEAALRESVAGKPAHSWRDPMVQSATTSE